MHRPAFELSIDTEFCAAHAIVIRGAREPVHGHNWKVTATVAGDSLDADGLLCDFHALEHHLDQIVAPFRNNDFNVTPPFDRVNPSAERIAEHLGQSLERLLPSGVRLASLRITEAPGCAAVWRPPPPVDPATAPSGRMNRP